MAQPFCARCGKALEQVDMFGKGAVVLGSVPTLYNGVVCTICKKVECAACKGQPFDRPCSWCGGKVSPAYANLIGEASVAAAAPPAAQPIPSATRPVTPPASLEAGYTRGDRIAVGGVLIAALLVEVYWRLLWMTEPDFQVTTAMGWGTLRSFAAWAAIALLVWRKARRQTENSAPRLALTATAILIGVAGLMLLSLPNSGLYGAVALAGGLAMIAGCLMEGRAVGVSTPVPQGIEWLIFGGAALAWGGAEVVDAFRMSTELHAPFLIILTSTFAFALAWVALIACTHLAVDRPPRVRATAAMWQIIFGAISIASCLYMLISQDFRYPIPYLLSGAGGLAAIVGGNMVRRAVVVRQWAPASTGTPTWQPVGVAQPAQTAEANRNAGLKNMLIGAALCIGGFVLTQSSYESASPGGSYAIFWGAVIFGGLQLLVGLFQLITGK